MLRWQLVAIDDVMKLDVQMAVGSYWWSCIAWWLMALGRNWWSYVA